MLVQVEKDVYVDHSDIYLIRQDLLHSTENWFMFYYAKTGFGDFDFVALSESYAKKIIKYINEDNISSLAKYLDKLWLREDACDIAKNPLSHTNTV